MKEHFRFAVAYWHTLCGTGGDQFPNNLNEITEAMLVILQAGGFQGGGVNFDAKTRRNSTDLEDLVHAHIGGMDIFARALVTADAILQKSPYVKMRKNRYSSFDNGNGKAFENGELSLTDLAKLAMENGEPEQISGKQERFENIVNWFI